VTRRVVVTGIGTVSPLGLNVVDTWAAATAGVSGVGPLTYFPAEGYRTRVAAELKGFVARNYFGVKETRRMDPCAQYAVVAAREAMADANLAIDHDLAPRAAVVLGSGIGGLYTCASSVVQLHEKGPARTSPFLIPMVLPDTAVAMVSLEFGLRGPSFSVSSACASSTNAIGEAFGMVRRGEADVALCGGAEAGIVPIAVAGFGAMRATTARNDDPEHASRPFDRDRDGFVMGEGSAILVLEPLEQARARGAHIYCELVGYGSTSDAYHITAPDETARGAIACMRAAIEMAGLQTSDVGYINAHGTSTPLNDVTETRAIKALLGEQAYSVPVSSTKSTHGHLLGAAGALEAIMCIKAIQENLLPPTMNLDNPDDECDLDYVPNVAREASVDVILSNSFGFGGHNAALVFQRA